MSQMYPTSEDLELAEEDIQEFLDDPVVLELQRIQEEATRQAEQGQIVDIPDFLESDEYAEFDYSLDADDQALVEHPDYTYADQYNVLDINKMLVCKTAEFNPSSGVVEEITANPDDPSHLFEAMSRSERASTHGTLGKFEQMGVNKTSHVSEFFAKDAMNAVYEKYALKSSIVSRSTSSKIDIVKGDFNMAESHSYIFSAANKDFHAMFHKSYLLQMNHRLTQEAIEKNRNFFPSGQQRNPDHMQDSFTWEKFQKMALQCAQDAFKRTQYIMEMRRTQEAVQETLKPYREQFKQRMQPKIKDENVIEGFGKTFRVHKGEKPKAAATRIRTEFKAYAAKKFDEYQGKGMESILAQGIASSRGSKVVTVDHLKQASEIFSRAKKNPVEFRSMSRIIRQVTGNDQQAQQQLIHSMDGRSSFQRSQKNLERMGMHLHALSEGRTRLRKEDRIHGQAFAATATLGVPPKPLKVALNEAIKAGGHTPQEVLDVRKRMQNAANRIKDDSGKDKTREQLLDKVRQDKTPDQTIDQKPKPSWQDDQDDGYSPDGPGGGRGKRRR